MPDTLEKQYNDLKAEIQKGKHSIHTRFLFEGEGRITPEELIQAAEGLYSNRLAQLQGVLTMLDSVTTDNKELSTIEKNNIQRILGNKTTLNNTEDLANFFKKQTKQQIESLYQAQSIILKNPYRLTASIYAQSGESQKIQAKYHTRTAEFLEQVLTNSEINGRIGNENINLIYKALEQSFVEVEIEGQSYLDFRNVTFKGLIYSLESKQKQAQNINDDNLLTNIAYAIDRLRKLGKNTDIEEEKSIDNASTNTPPKPEKDDAKDYGTNAHNRLIEIIGDREGKDPTTAEEINEAFNIYKAIEGDENKRRFLHDLFTHYVEKGKPIISNEQVEAILIDNKNWSLTASTIKAAIQESTNNMDAGRKISQALTNLRKPHLFEQILLHEYTNNSGNAANIFVPLQTNSSNDNVQTRYEAYNRVTEQIGQIEAILKENAHALKGKDAKNASPAAPAPEHDKIVHNHTSLSALKKSANFYKEKRNAAEQSRLRYGFGIIAFLAIAIPTTSATLNFFGVAALTTAAGATVGAAIVTSVIVPIVIATITSLFFLNKRAKERDENQYELEALHSDAQLSKKDQETLEKETNQEIAKADKKSNNAAKTFAATTSATIIGIAFAATFATAMGAIGATFVIGTLIAATIGAAALFYAKKQDADDLHDLKNIIESPKHQHEHGISSQARDQNLGKGHETGNPGHKSHTAALQSQHHHHSVHAQG